MGNYCFFIAASWGKGAISEHFQALAHHLVERGHRVVYLPHGLKINVDEGDLHVRSFPSPRPTKPRDFVFLHRLIRQYRPDCLIANFGAANVMTIVGWLHRVPCRVDWYRTLSTQMEFDSTAAPWKNSFLKWRKRLVYQLTTLVVANAEATRRDAISVYRIKPSKTHVFFNSVVDMQADLPDTVGRDPNVVLCPGRLAPSKGQDVLIRALALLKPQQITPQVRFIGAGSQLATCQKLAGELDVDNQCIFVGAVPHVEMYREMASAAFTVVPSRSEAFGLVNVESMSVGTPVIASAVGGIPEIIRDGIDGFLVPPDDPEALAEKIKLLYSNPARREQMGQNARQRFLDCFELRANIVKQADWFESLVANTKS